MVQNKLISQKLLGEIEAIQKEYPELECIEIDKQIILKGKFDFYKRDSKTGKPPIYDEYFVEITIYRDFPLSIPKVKEIANKIDREYEHIHRTGELCLGVKSEIYLLLQKDPTIKGFFENILIPNLFAYSFYKKYQYMPWGERKGSKSGIFSRYSEIFETADISTLVLLLDIIIKGNYKGNSPCPCGSGKSLNECHGENIYKLWCIPCNHLINDYYALIYLKLLLELPKIMNGKYSTY